MKNYLKKFATLLTTLTMVVVLGVCLTACGSSDKELSKEEYEANLKAAEYSASVRENNEETKSFFEGMATQMGVKADTIEWMVMGEKEDDMVYVYKFTSSDNAKTVVNAYEEMMDESFKAMEEAGASKEEIAEAKAEAKNMVIKRVGSVVVSGSKTGVNAAQGK